MNGNKRWIGFVLCLAIAACGLLSGCAGKNGTVVAKVNGEPITVKDVNLCADYILMGYGMSRADITDADAMKSLNSDALNMAVMNKIVMRKGTEDKYYPLSADDAKEVDDSVSQMASYLPPGMTKDDFRSLETQRIVKQHLQDDINKGVSVTDDEVKAEYDKVVAAQEDSFTKDATAYESAKYDGMTVIVYRPEGYRYVKHIMIAIPEDIASKIADAQNAGDTDTVKTLRDQGLQQIKAKADEVLAKVQNGEDFDALMAQYGEDPGMRQEPEKTKGYEIGSATDFVPEFKDAAMALQNVGDTTGLVATDYGYHIIKYVGNVPPGPMKYDDVKTSLKNQLLGNKQADAWNAAYAHWKSEVTIEQHPELIPVDVPSAPSASAS